MSTSTTDVPQNQPEVEAIPVVRNDDLERLLRRFEAAQKPKPAERPAADLFTREPYQFD